MPNTPRDLDDLRLAPVALAVDAQISSLAELSPEQLRLRIAVESNLGERTEDEREQALLATVGYCIDTHGWVLSRDPRGIRMTHDRRTLVLGVPATFDAYVSGRQLATAS
jgi:hypothetical protein